LGSLIKNDLKKISGNASKYSDLDILKKMISIQIFIEDIHESIHGALEFRASVSLFPVTCFDTLSYI